MKGIRKNPLKQAIREGKLVCGAFVFIPAAEAVEILGEAGWDFIVVDQEHSAFGVDLLRNCIVAADAVGVVPLVRVADNEPRLIEQALDLGALGVVVPHVTNAEEAARAVRAARYAKPGNRGFCHFARSARWGKYGGGPEYTNLADDSAMVCLIIEDDAAITNIESIVSVEGVDMICPGPGDLSCDLGLLGQFDHPIVREKIEKTVNAAKAKGVPIGLFSMGPHDAKYWIDKGVQLFFAESDVNLLGQRAHKIKMLWDKELHPDLAEVTKSKE